MNPNKEFWKSRYDTNQIGWDVGTITTPLKEYIDQLEDKNLKILIPGAGNSHEAEYLHHKGFTNIFVIDLVKTPLNNLAKRMPDFPKNNLLHGNFFALNDTYDLIIEQTFYCAIQPHLRDNYVTKMAELLSVHGKIAGVLFQFPLTEQGPPFGGSKEEYQNRFSKLFHIKTLETSYNSIKPRKGMELFAIFEKK